MNPYSMDLRLRVVMAHENGEGSYRELAERFEIARQTVGNWCRRHVREGHCEARPHGGRGPKAKIDKKGMELLRDYVKKEPDATIAARCAYYKRECGVVVSISTMGRILLNEGLTHKKNSKSRSRRHA